MVDQLEESIQPLRRKTEERANQRGAFPCFLSNAEAQPGASYSPFRDVSLRGALPGAELRCEASLPCRAACCLAPFADQHFSGVVPTGDVAAISALPRRVARAGLSLAWCGAPPRGRHPRSDDRRWAHLRVGAIRTPNRPSTRGSASSESQGWSIGKISRGSYPLDYLSYIDFPVSHHRLDRERQRGLSGQTPELHRVRSGLRTKLFSGGVSSSCNEAVGIAVDCRLGRRQI